MASHPTKKDIYGPGTFTDVNFTPVPQECTRILRHLAETTPGFTTDPAILDNVHFHGADYPIIPGIVGSEISTMRGNATGKISIDTDQAALYPATPSLVFLDGKNIGEFMKSGEASKVWTDLDRGCLDRNPMHYRSWAIYPTKDPEVWFQIMGGLDPPKLLRGFDLDPYAPAKTNDEAYQLIKAELEKYSARELEMKCMEKGLSGGTCYTPKAWRETLMGQLLGKHPLINYKVQRQAVMTPPVPFPVTEDRRPLAGIKIIELARVIAAPSAGAALASFGADVVRIQSQDLPDPNLTQFSLTVGKRTCALDLTKEEDKKQLHKLMQDADVIIQGYTKGSLARKGFGLDDLLEMANRRGKGIIYLDLNCYGTEGYYAERPGWQQIGDAVSGCSYVCGKAYGFPEGTGVLPSLPIADMLCGAVAAVSIMMAIRDRARHGGSYYSNASLTATDTVQVSEDFSLYSPEVVKKIQDTHNFAPMTPDLHVLDLLSVVFSAWVKTTDVLKRNEIFTVFDNTPFGHSLRMLAPLVRYENAEASPKWLTSPKPYCYDEEIAFAGTT